MLTADQQELIQETIKRLEIRAKACWQNPNPYYDEPKSKNEWREIKIKMAELEKIKQKQ